MIATLKLAGGLLLFVIGNIALGSINAIITKTWDKRTFFNGLIKAGIVIAVFGVTYLAGWLNPDLLVIQIDDQTVSVLQAVYVILFAGYVYYGGSVLGKLKNIITSKSKDIGAKEKDSSQVGAPDAPETK